MNSLQRLGEWTRQRSDDQWTDSSVVIETVSNPGWIVKVELKGAGLENREFEEIEEGVGATPQDRWFCCYIEQGVWKGAGDETQLERIIETFLDWAEPNRQ
ncbi:Imm53 family immunity protein [Luteipulveratus mongoliensis]|uniref:Imm53 family immunity protein n=1 Tax=Luteipulveratus mongoliensis TaxID=571913 RepID=UPI0006965BB4|nr:Imm53 family immunity protein [Luteipulveratus mongoliensis]